MIICVKKFSNFILISGTTSSTVMITTTTNTASLFPTGDDESCIYLLNEIFLTLRILN